MHLLPKRIDPRWIKGYFNACADEPPPLPPNAAPRIGIAAGFARGDLSGRSPKREALTTGMDRDIHPVKLKRLDNHKSFDVFGEHLEFGDLFDGHPLAGSL